MSDTTIRRPIRWSSAENTNVGMVREVNEDSILSAPALQLWVVADGMGGYEAGNVASNMIVQALGELSSLTSISDMVDSVEDCLIDANHRILEYADIMLDGRTLGSTVVTLLIKGHVGICLWAGDSRLYRYRNKQLIQLSRDHSQVEEMLLQGLLTPEEAENHPDSNVITRAIGASQEVYIDIDVFNVQLGDSFFLCSDGLYNMVSDEEICDVISRLPVDEAVETLVQMALDEGANDNVSVILVKGEPDAAFSTQVNLQE
ncbi:MAG TPA: serine/threonine-protein phosphatase [Gammaproteobacteria bacterium]|nr:serine/threonine-protein phosphatase [Gammaproteobacteria bacterium]